jgi:light-regulated signal transduction histidine kinase (bacteriophytochrome)
MLYISKGECKIEYDEIAKLEQEDELKASILQGLKFIYEDLDLHKNDLHKKLETEYKLKALEQRNKELEQFNYIASHDMKEPMRTIRSFSDLLQKKYASQLDDKGKLFLNYISDSSKRLYNLIEGLLDFTKVNELNEKQEIDCNYIIRKVIQDINSSIKSSNAQIEFSDLPTIIANEVSMTQIFQNLISNAIKYKHPDRIPVINITHQSNRNYHQFAVKDNGLGIEDVYHDKVFELFGRLHNKAEIEGTGIGLSICKKIIESAGGRIELRSILGTGSTFLFTIPKLGH